MNVTSKRKDLQLSPRTDTGEPSNENINTGEGNKARKKKECKRENKK